MCYDRKHLFLSIFHDTEITSWLKTSSLFTPSIPRGFCEGLFSRKNNPASILFCNCIPEKQGYYGSRTVLIRVRRDFLVFNLQATFLLRFLLNFASGLLLQRSGHPSILVGQESKLGSGESKMSKILTIACVQSVVHSFFQIYFIFSA